jgi:nicotinamidase/pyrazinamidase
MISKGKLMIIIDPQYDFISGTLPVPGAKEAMDKLAQYIEENPDEYDAFICTVDWHPYDHCSFKEEGGEWPRHCVQHSVGAAIYEPLLQVIADKLLYVARKGDEKCYEEYSAFNGKRDTHDHLERAEALNYFITQYEEIEICGIAGNVCVLNSIVDLMNNPNTHIRENWERIFDKDDYLDFLVVRGEYSPSLDDGTALRNIVSRYALTYTE